jgi:hypothetical protein
MVDSPTKPAHTQAPQSLRVQRDQAPLSKPLELLQQQEPLGPVQDASRIREVLQSLTGF